MHIDAMHTTTGTDPLPTGIHRHAEQRSWLLVTEQSTYALGVTDNDMLLQLHWGGRIPSFADIPTASIPPERASQDTNLFTTEEFPGYGGLRYGEIAAQVTFTDGTRDLDLRFVDAEIHQEGELPELRVHLHDAVYPLQIFLSYRIDIANDLVIRSARFVNQGNKPIVLNRAYSATWHLPRQLSPTPRRLTTLAGDWAGETRIQQRPIVAGSVQIESRKGITGSNAYPWFAIDAQATEQQGEVYFGTLAWSGSWSCHISTNILGITTINGGIHDHDFAWVLEEGQHFDAPDFVAGFTSKGINGTRHRLHRYVHDHVLPHPQVAHPRPVLYNSWEATFFDVSAENQIELAERAAQIGSELFVVDDGWFPGRNHDHAGLGDWSVDPKKFPHGLRPLVDRVNELGMQFGIWFEPEMVNPDSDLYRQHPDWIYHFPTRTRHEARNQLVLNVGRQDVQDYLINTIDRLVEENQISFIKWDMNRPISEPGWPEYNANGHDSREIWVRHTQGVYAIMDALRARHPDLSIESCSSGGSRADLSILRRTDQVWSSDNTHPDARLFIQEGISYILPGRVMGAWVTDTPSDRRTNEIPLAYRFHVAMMGMLGIGGHLLHWSQEDLDEASRWISVYKKIRQVVQDGEQNWLISPKETEGNLAIVQCNAEDGHEGVVFAFRRTNPFREALPALRLQGLQPNVRYRVKELGHEEHTSEIELSGAALMSRGIDLPLERSSYASCILHVEKI